jgi:hypothetical protein
MNLHLAEIALKVHQEPTRPPRRSGWMASVGKIGHCRQHYHSSHAAKIARAQSGREHLADRMLVVGADVARPHFAMSEGASDRPAPSLTQRGRAMQQKYQGLCRS